MKVKSSVSELPQALEVVIGTERAPFHYTYIREILPFLGLSKAPSAGDCDDLSRIVYHRITGLIQMFDVVQLGLEAEGSTLPASSVQAALEALMFQVEIGRLTAEALYKLYERDSRDFQGPQ